MRSVGLLLLLGALGGCGDTDDDKEPVDTGDGGIDAGGEDGGEDGGPVADAAMDAGRDAGDAGASDAGDGGSELGAALSLDGVRTDRRRAELITPPFCATSARCAPADAGITEQGCATVTLSQYDRSVSSGDSADCIDAQLDFAACVAAGGTCLEATARCGPVLVSRETRCAAQ